MIGIPITEAVTWLCWGRPRSRLALRRWRGLLGVSLPDEHQKNLEAAGCRIVEAIASGMIRSLGVPYPAGGNPEPIPHAFLMRGVFVDPLADTEIVVDWQIERNWGRDVEGYRHVVLSKEDFCRTFELPSKPTKKQRAKPKSPSRRFSESQVRHWYTNTWIPECETKGVVPTRDDDALAARTAFGSLVSRTTLRELRKTSAPSHWQRAGPKPSSR